MFTVFTPTYNRVGTLKRLYDSLVMQGDSELVWLVVDDGSTDDTKKLINKLKKENKIKIEYYYQKNSGKMSAVNYAYKNCNTKYILTIDSDDMMYKGFLSKLKKDVLLIETKEDVAGIVYLTSIFGTKDEIVGTKLPDDKTICKFYDIYKKYECKGDKCIVWKSDIISNYSFPIIDGEKFIPDAYLMYQVSKKYNVMTMNSIGTVVEYLDSGYSNNYFNLVRNNPKGTMLYYLELYSIEKKLYNIYAYILFGIYAKYSFKYIFRRHPAKVWVMLLYFPTLFIAKIRR